VTRRVLPERQGTYETHAAMIERAESWLINTWRAGIVLTNCARQDGREIADVFAARHSGDDTMIIECKVSRADFLADLKKQHRQDGMALGNRRYYFVPDGLVLPEEIPNPWGLIYWQTNKRVWAKIALPVEADRASERYVFYNGLYLYQRGRRTRVWQ
jgi:hypothetical protein